MLLKKLFLFVRYDDYTGLNDGPCLLALGVNSRWRVGIMKPMELVNKGKEVLAACERHSQSGHARFGAKGSKRQVWSYQAQWCHLKLTIKICFIWSIVRITYYIYDAGYSIGKDEKDLLVIVNLCDRKDWALPAFSQLYICFNWITGYYLRMTKSPMSGNKFSLYYGDIFISMYCNVRKAIIFGKYNLHIKIT